MSFLRGAPLLGLDSSKSFLLVYSSYQQPQVCRGCLVGILMRQLTEDSTQSLQLQPKPRYQRAKRRRGDVYLWTLITKRIFLSSTTTAAQMCRSFFTPTPTKSWFNYGTKPADLKQLNESWCYRWPCFLPPPPWSLARKTSFIRKQWFCLSCLPPMRTLSKLHHTS